MRRSQLKRSRACFPGTPSKRPSMNRAQGGRKERQKAKSKGSDDKRSRRAREAERNEKDGTVSSEGPKGARRAWTEKSGPDASREKTRDPRNQGSTQRRAEGGRRSSQACRPFVTARQNCPSLVDKETLIQRPKKGGLFFSYCISFVSILVAKVKVLPGGGVLFRICLSRGHPWSRGDPPGRWPRFVLFRSFFFFPCFLSCASLSRMRRTFRCVAPCSVPHLHLRCLLQPLSSLDDGAERRCCPPPCPRGGMQPPVDKRAACTVVRRVRVSPRLWSCADRRQVTTAGQRDRTSTAKKAHSVRRTDGRPCLTSGLLEETLVSDRFL